MYEKKCVISDTDTELVLEAAHILKFSSSGENISTNGLLFRSDLHSLFDAGLLLIHPINLTVHFHPSLKSTCYATFENKKINCRKDGKMPNQKYLQDKWDKSYWAK